MKKKVLVFGFGNSVHHSKDIAVCVINYLRSQNNVHNLELLDLCGEENLLQCIESSGQMIIIDANHSRSQREQVRVYEGVEMDAYITRRNGDNVHEYDLREALREAASRGKLPYHRALVGIKTDLSDKDSENGALIDNAVNRVCQKVFEITEYWKI